MQVLRGLLIAYFLMSSFLSGFSQQKADFMTIDTKTYQYYLDEKWDSLIHWGKIAAENEIDYYYLRYRIGVAWYEKENYGRAIRNFEAAYEYNSAEPLLNEYLYFANLFYNRPLQAGYYHRNLTDSYVQQKKFLKRKTLNNISISSGYFFSNDIERNGDIDKLWNDSSLYIGDNLLKDYYFGHAGMGFNLTKRLTMYAGFTELSFGRRHKYRYTTDLQIDSIVQTEFTNDYYSYNDGSHSVDTRSNQNGIYAAFNYYAGKNWVISPAFHYIHVGLNFEAMQYDSVSKRAIQYVNKVDGQTHYFDYLANEYTFQTKKVDIDHYTFGLGVSRAFPFFTLGAGAYYTFMNDFQTQQYNISVAYFPFGNLNYYGVTNLKYYTQNVDIPGVDSERLLFYQSFGARILNKLWVEGSIRYGELKNTCWDNAFIVYNVPDGSQYVGAITFISPLNKNFELNLTCELTGREGSYLYDGIQKDEAANGLQENNYQTQSIIIGLNWKL